jgi:cation:H+ antiporter
MALLQFLVGLILLIVGAELLVRGATKLASHWGISPLIVGLTVVAFGTSSPELAISINGVLSGQANITLGNVIGSNIFNVLFILGLSAIIIPLTVSKQLIRFDVPLMIGISLAVLFLSFDQLINRMDGLFLTAGLIVYLGFLIMMSFRNRTDHSSPSTDPQGTLVSPQPSNWLLNSVFVVVGLAMLILGSRWFVDSAVLFAEYLGVSELIIGLTIVAAGTSMPEVVTSVIAAAKGERDIAVGNIVGSNLFNLLAVLGITGLIAPQGIPVSEAVVGFDLPLMIAVAIACLPIFFTGGSIDRWEGALFLGYYGAYTLFLILNATQHDFLPLFNSIMWYFVIPLTLITILIVIVQEFGNSQKSPTPQGPSKS